MNSLNLINKADELVKLNSLFLNSIDLANKVGSVKGLFMSNSDLRTMYDYNLDMMNCLRSLTSLLRKKLELYDDEYSDISEGKNEIYKTYEISSVDGNIKFVGALTEDSTPDDYFYINVGKKNIVDCEWVNSTLCPYLLETTDNIESNFNIDGIENELRGVLLEAKGFGYNINI